MKPSQISPWSWVKLNIQRALAKGGWRQFVIYGVIVVLLLGALALTFELGVNKSGVDNYWEKATPFESKNPFAAAFYHLFTSGGESQMGSSYMGLVITIIGVIMVAILTSLFTNAFGKASLRYLRGESKYEVMHHIAIFGYQEMIPGLIKQLFDHKYNHCYYLIMTNRVEKARNDLFQVLTKEQMKRIILLKGDIATKIDLSAMNVDKAQRIFIIGEDASESDYSHDTDVLQCLKSITNIISQARAKGPANREKILCHVLFENHFTLTFFQHTDLNKEVFDNLAFFPFNLHEIWASKVFVNDSLEPGKKGTYLPLEGCSGITKDSGDHVHLFVIGMSHVGAAMGTQAAHIAHYPNFITNPKHKTRITFIDRNAREEMYHLQGTMEAMFQTSRWRFADAGASDYCYLKSHIEGTPWHNPLIDRESSSPYKSEDDHLGKDFIDLEWEFIQGDPENPVIQEYIDSVAKDRHTRLTVAVCTPNSNEAIAISLNLPPSVYESAIQILVYQKKGDSIVETLSCGSDAGYSRYSKIRPFGMVSDAYDLTLVNKLVFVASNLNEVGPLSFSDTIASDAYSQIYQASSSKSAAANMWSNMLNAAHMWTKLRSINSENGSIPEEDIEILAETEHIRWNAEQMLAQFRPLTEAEQKAWSSGEVTKDQLKRERYAHLDIAARSRLKDIDPKAVDYDVKLVRSIPEIYSKLG